MPCHYCGGNNTEYDEAQGTTFCIECGTVTEENSIVAELQFGEKANGAAVLQGAFVAAGQVRALSGSRGRHYMESRQLSLEVGKREIRKLANSLRLSEHYVSMAERYYNLALTHKFTRGRKVSHVAAACMYIACRYEKTSHMLIDFSDALQVLPPSSIHSLKFL